MQPLDTTTATSNATARITSASNNVQWLSSSGTQPAVVSKVDNGLVTLQIGSREIIAQNALQLKVGEKVNVRIEQTSGGAVLKVSRLDTPSQQPVSILLKNMPSVKSGEAIFGYIKSSSSNNQSLQLLNTSVRLPVQTNWSDGQFIKAVATNNPDRFKLSAASPLNHLIPALSRLMANQNPAPVEAQSLSDLKSILTSLVKNQPTNNASSTANNLTSPELKRIMSAMNSALQSSASTSAINGAGKSADQVGLSPLLRQLGSSINLQSLFKPATIQQWIQNTFQSPLSLKEAAFWPAASQRSSLIRQIQTALDTALQQNIALATKNREIDSQQVARLLRDIASTLDGLDQNNLLQQVKVKTQQELQQPMAFNLNLPFQNDERLDWIKLSLQQKSAKPNQQEGWKFRLDIRLPGLGQMTSIVQLQQLDIGIDFWVENDNIRGKFENALPELRRHLSNHGFLMTHCQCQIGAPPTFDGPESILPEGENFLDIRV